MGRAEGIEKTLAERSGLPYVSTAAAPVRGAGPVQLVKNLWHLLDGTVRASRALGRLRPDAIFATGGFVSVPVVLGGWLRGVPSLVYLPDLEPGLAVKGLATIAARIGVTAPETGRFFKSKKVVVTGYPVRVEFETLSREEARRRFSIGAERAVLVFGGSRGAHALNEAVAGCLEQLLEACTLVHVCGSDDFTALNAQRQALPEDKRARYLLFDYLHQEMPAAIKAADLVVCRAGASVLGELTVSGAPAILVPYPYAGEHQRDNANYLAAREAAIIIENDALGTELLPTVRRLLADDSELRRLRENARALGRPGAARSLAEVLTLLADKEARGHADDH